MAAKLDLCCHKSSVRLVLLVFFIIVYLCIGALIFSLIEGPHENDLRQEVMTIRNNFLNRHDCIDDDALEKLIEAVVIATNRGVSATSNVTMSEPNWSFGQSLFFAGTVITTIGYGRVTPLSEVGKGFCILYALMGIPLTLIMLTAIVERLMVPTTKLLQFLFRRLGHLYKVFHIQLLHLCVMILFLVLFIFLIPAGIYSALEPSWNYLDAFYYCFISMTTIGLGDYIPGDSPEQNLRAVYKVATTCYLFIGLILMMLILAVLYEIPELNIGFHFYMKSDSQDEERVTLRSAIDSSGATYSKQVDDEESPTSYQQETNQTAAK